MTAMPTLNAGTEPTAAQWQTLLPLKAIKGSDQTVNNSTTLVNDSALLIPVTANAIYEFRLRVVYNSGATPGFKIGFAVPAGTIIRYTTLIRATTWQSFVQIESDAPAMDGTGSDNPFNAWGEITTAGTAGNVNFKWAQFTANASNTIVRANSSFIARQIG